MCRTGDRMLADRLFRDLSASWNAAHRAPNLLLFPIMMSRSIRFILMCVLICATSQVEASAARAPRHGPLSQEQARLRLEHSQELLGKYYDRSAVRFGQNVAKINSDIYRWTRDRLPAEYKKDHQKIAQAIIDESLKHQFDPVFLLSIIQTESRFNPKALGAAGEIGLMQIMPGTGEWIAAKAKLPYKNKNTLRDPIANIRLGAAYLAFLRDRFDMHARLYIAAYNMGQRNVDHAQSRNVWPKDYPGAVMRNYVEFYSALKEKRAPADAAVNEATTFSSRI